MKLKVKENGNVHINGVTVNASAVRSVKTLQDISKLGLFSSFEDGNKRDAEKALFDHLIPSASKSIVPVENKS